MKKYLIIIFVLILCGCEIEIKDSQYEYIDTLGNKGIAKDCWSNFGHYHCDLEDGTRVQVASYKEVK